MSELSKKQTIINIMKGYDDNTLIALLAIKSQFTTQQLEIIATKINENTKKIILKYL